MMHEAKGKCRDIGSSKTASSSPLGKRSRHSRGSPASRIIAILCKTLEGGVKERRKRSVGGKTSPRATFSFVSRTERGTSGTTP